MEIKSTTRSCSAWHWAHADSYVWRRRHSIVPVSTIPSATAPATWVNTSLPIWMDWTMTSCQRIGSCITKRKVGSNAWCFDCVESDCLLNQHAKELISPRKTSQHNSRGCTSAWVYVLCVILPVCQVRVAVGDSCLRCCVKCNVFRALIISLVCWVDLYGRSGPRSVLDYAFEVGCLSVNIYTNVAILVCVFEVGSLSVLCIHTYVVISPRIRKY